MTFSKEFHLQQLGKAIALAANLFKDKVDKQGAPYILHCLKVMEKCSNDPETKVVGVLHDVPEDIPEYTVDRLKDELALTTKQYVALTLLTHNQDDPYDAYIRSITVSDMARDVKLADLRHNTDILRLKGLRKKDFERLEKYHRAFVYLSE